MPGSESWRQHGQTVPGSIISVQLSIIVGIANVVSCLTFSAVTSLSILSGRNVAENESHPGRGWDSIIAVSKI